MHRCQVANNSISTVAFVNRNYIAMKLVSVCVWGGGEQAIQHRKIFQSLIACIVAQVKSFL